MAVSMASFMLLKLGARLRAGLSALLMKLYPLIKEMLQLLRFASSKPTHVTNSPADPRTISYGENGHQPRIRKCLVYHQMN